MLKISAMKGFITTRTREEATSIENNKFLTEDYQEDNRGNKLHIICHPN